MFQASIPDCKRWLSRHCSFENTCHFKHDPAKQDLKSNAREAIPSHQSTNCWYWLRGGCKLQNKCWYQHDPDKKSSTLKDLNATGEKNANLFSSYILLLILLHTISKLTLLWSFYYRKESCVLLCHLPWIKYSWSVHCSIKLHTQISSGLVRFSVTREE